MDWIQSLIKAINYMESRLTQDISVGDVAGKVYAASGNFQRVFHLVTGITIGDYIRNRRMSLAGQELLHPKTRIIDVAMKYQYDTQESFSRAFSRFHGINPSDVRKHLSMLKYFHPLSINIMIQGGFNMSNSLEILTSG
ncbi:MAG: AraC family transcriptional regulator [Defluviitaleaceae bacterium]|nr:AraC family transcriptional regulator [Defluviitaleaceae bacterium]